MFISQFHLVLAIQACIGYSHVVVISTGMYYFFITTLSTVRISSWTLPNRKQGSLWWWRPCDLTGFVYSQHRPVTDRWRGGQT